MRTASLCRRTCEQRSLASYTRAIPPSTKCQWRPDIFGSRRLRTPFRKKCDGCNPCKMSGKNIKPDLPSTGKTHYRHMDFIGPITEKNQRFYILLSMDRYNKWPASSFWISTDGQTAVRFFKLIYGTPYIHTPTGSVERGVSLLKEKLLTNIKAGKTQAKPWT